ncbi:MAG TPA: META domain-containing protein [Reyranella sp.]|jgi:heat shock protein HslJ
MKIIAFLGAVALAAIAGCLPMAATAQSPSLDGTAWVLTSLAGRAVTGPAVTGHFENGRVQGTDGCNRYTSTYTTKGTAIQIGPKGAATQMACLPDVMKQASAFAAALAGARTYRVNAGRLELMGGDGAILSTFAAQPQSLAGSSWHATGINNGRDAVVSLVAGSTATMRFAADGKVSGSGGCNTYTSTWKADGNALAFTPAAATRKMCDPGVMTQEQAFFAALGSVATMRLEGDGLELRTAQGALAVMLTRTP